MKSFWLFRSNLRQFESYHKYRTLKEFEENCWDFYLIQGLWFLRNNYFDEVIIWRLKPKGKEPFTITFDVNGKKFKQMFVEDFSECMKLPKPYVTFWRGGFQEYDNLTKTYYNFFKPRSLYCGTGKRITPQYGGKYDMILMEDERDFNKKFNCIPFYKTACPTIFYKYGSKQWYDICFPANFMQKTYKGQEFFIREISKSNFLKSLNIINIGNKPKVGENICKKYGVKNIEFGGLKTRSEVNQIFNESKFGIVCSNRTDGCPRVISEIMSTGTPIIIRDMTRVLKYYKGSGTIPFKDNEIVTKIKGAFKNYDVFKTLAINNLDRISMNSICNKNYYLWTKK
jgi:hypothetical protein